ncbi:hypothetical protein GT347_15830 [Xylophilus rhododendri]|uniref:Uncharacterized protein n=1 Tax=Xylophilus rhododendri TaxID=2697032 RepID=A0A857J659_9BURK|nr:hypothetical protein [Xylophilus rhododendri]QHI99316.1 hypothetical protein GT347_15830 [Xylophilus rhododendri]
MQVDDTRPQPARTVQLPGNPPLVAQGQDEADFEPTRFEELPPELALMLSDIWLKLHPAENPIGPIASGNAHLHDVYRQPLRASDLIRALYCAQDDTQLRAAIDALADAPVQYQEDCWAHVWKILPRWVTPCSTWQLQALLDHLLSRFPTAPALRLQQMQRAVRFVDACHSDAWSREFHDRLLRACLELPEIPRALWRLLLQLRHTSVADPEAGPERIEDIDGAERLPAARRAELALLLRCMDQRYRQRTLAEMLDEIAEVETVADPAVRLDLLQWLRIRRATARTEDADTVAAARCRALLNIEGAAQREEVLRMLPLKEGELSVDTLRKELPGLPPVAAMRVLGAHFYRLLEAAGGRRLLADCLVPLLLRSRETPSGHLAFLHLLALRVHLVCAVGLAPQLPDLLLEECARLEPCLRLALLDKLSTANWRSSETRQVWAREWRACLRQSIETLQHARTAAQAWPALRCLLVTLRRPELRDTVLQTVLSKLPLLAAGDLALALKEVVLHCLFSPFLTSREQVTQLIAACAELPFHLRPGLLMQIRKLIAPHHEGEDEGLLALERQTAEAVERWRALPADRTDI